MDEYAWNSANAPPVLPLIFNITRQHAMHAERDIVLRILSVCPSKARIVCKRRVISAPFLISGRSIILVFFSPTAITKFQEHPQRRP